MSAKTESDKEKKRVGLLEILREVAGRLKEEILLLAFLFALLVAYVAISIGQFSNWVAVTFITLYMIASGCYLALKTRKIGSQLQEESKEYVEWKVGYPSAFQNPYKIAEKRPRLGIVHFNLDFKIINHMRKSLLINVYVKSPTQAVVFAWDSPKKVWRRRLGIIPYREEVKIALDDLETRSISPNEEERIVFHGLYRPHFAYEDFSRRTEIVLTFRIYGKGEEGFLSLTYVDTHDKKLYIPFKDVVQYVKKT